MTSSGIREAVQSLDPKVHGALRRALERRNGSRIDPDGMVLSELRRAAELAPQQSQLDGESFHLVANKSITPNLLDMTFSEFARTGRFLRFRSRVLQDDFYMVADESLKPRLPDQTLVVYTAGEMRTLLLCDPNEKDLVFLHELKKRFGVEIEN